MAQRGPHFYRTSVKYEDDRCTQRQNAEEPRPSEHARDGSSIATPRRHPWCTPNWPGTGEQRAEARR